MSYFANKPLIVVQVFAVKARDANGVIYNCKPDPVTVNETSHAFACVLTARGFSKPVLVLA